MAGDGERFYSLTGLARVDHDLQVAFLDGAVPDGTAGERHASLSGFEDRSVVGQGLPMGDLLGDATLLPFPLVWCTGAGCITWVRHAQSACCESSLRVPTHYVPVAIALGVGLPRRLESVGKIKGQPALVCALCPLRPDYGLLMSVQIIIRCVTR